MHFLKVARVAAALVLIVLSCGGAAPCLADSPGADAAASPLPAIASKTAGSKRLDGFIPLDYKESTGKILLEVPIDTDMLYETALPRGMGSNDIGLDRGEPGEPRIVRFIRRGRTILMVQPNLAFRSDSNDPVERDAVTESFAISVLAGFAALAESGDRVLIDATSLARSDASGVVSALKASGQGDFKLDDARSAIEPASLKAFPRNSVMDATLTFAGDAPGRYVRDVTPTPQAITVRERQEFIALPEPGFVPRRSVPSDGFFDVQYTNETAALGEPTAVRYVERFRLQKKDPTAPVSEPVTPIVYYVDNAVPEPIRSALVEGASSWNDAFTAAGYRNAFRVDVLPAGADPLDVRYNVIEWAYRATRGYSYGNAIADPRTGEIIQGHVTLGALRMRQDYLIGEGLSSPYEQGDEHPGTLEKLVLARLRQLAAHETGHTLGLEHNFAASTQGRSSVMDYPAPLVALTRDGKIDFGHAYASGIGEWDKVAIRYGYGDYGDEASAAPALSKVLEDARKRGLFLLTDQDARVTSDPPGSAHPLANIWDNGSDPVAALDREMDVRRVALSRFGLRAIRSGMPLATMEDVLVPLYLHHRYESEAATKLIGGDFYTYAMRGDGQVAQRPVGARDQLRAVDAVLATLTPGALSLPPQIRNAIPPRPPNYDATRELFARWTGIVFDNVSPAAAAADLTFENLLAPDRASRLVEQHDADASLPGFDFVVSRIARSVFGNLGRDAYEAEIARVVQRSMVDRLTDLAESSPMNQVRAEAAMQLREIRARLLVRPPADRAEAAHRRSLADDIARFLSRPLRPMETRPTVDAPPGAPIGDLGEDEEPPR